MVEDDGLAWPERLVNIADCQFRGVVHLQEPSTALL
jgi:hypothetical protein